MLSASVHPQYHSVSPSLQLCSGTVPKSVSKEIKNESPIQSIDDQEDNVRGMIKRGCLLGQPLFIYRVSLV